MAMRPQLVFLFLGVLPSLGASYRTQNFYVMDAPTQHLAQQFGQAAERYRKEKAMEWLHQEMPPWQEPCPLKIKVTMGGAGGATQFCFDRGMVLGQHMEIEGSLDRLLVSVLPHEVTHTVFAYYFRTPVPRWADEGGAVLSEDQIERDRHDKLCRQILNSGRAIPLRRLFGLRDYPAGEVMSLYAEGYSVSQFLVDRSSRPAFLAFVAHGMQRGWDNAVQTHYRYHSVEELEQAWLLHLRNTKRQPVQLARNPVPASNNQGTRIVVRQTVPPAQPLSETPQPIVRGVAPYSDQENDLNGNPNRQPTSVRPGYLPDFNPDQGPPNIWGNPPTPPSRDGWQPAPIQPYRPPPVRLGTPRANSTLPADLGQPTPSTMSPVGYPQ